MQLHHRGYGATAARLTPDQKVGSSNLSALITHKHFIFPSPPPPISHFYQEEEGEEEEEEGKGREGEEDED